MSHSSAGLTSAVRLWSTLRLIDQLVRSSHAEWKRARGGAEEGQQGETPGTATRPPTYSMPTETSGP
ncbi:hypothetical protein ACH4GK_34345 [Streptomyces rimosus]|uniref:hypothetical protein n=1 Tax=Streptomyces rimosus TaxID=1927 RepID=UPI000B092A9D|nr:hypothetical protein [Streptomyces rimosus]